MFLRDGNKVKICPQYISTIPSSYCTSRNKISNLQNNYTYKYEIYHFSNFRSNARKYNKNKKEEKLSEAAIEKKLQPKQRVQKEMIIEGVLDVIFKAAGGENGIFCIPGDKNCFEPTQRYLSDTITEKVIFVFYNLIQISFV